MSGNYTDHVLNMAPGTGFRFAGSPVFVVDQNADQVKFARCRLGQRDMVLTSGVYSIPRESWDSAAKRSEIVAMRAQKHKLADCFR